MRNLESSLWSYSINSNYLCTNNTILPLQYYEKQVMTHEQEVFLHKLKSCTYSQDRSVCLNLSKLVATAVKKGSPKISSGSQAKPSRDPTSLTLPITSLRFISENNLTVVRFPSFFPVYFAEWTPKDTT